MVTTVKEFYKKHIEKHVFEVLDTPDTLDPPSSVPVSPTDASKKKVHRVMTLRAIFLSFSIVWALSGVLLTWLIKNGNDRGTFGDMFGAVNALFSAFAFGGLVYTLYVQRYELSLQRKELELQRDEVKRNGDQLEEQKNVMIQQSFDNMFFKLIEHHHNLVNSLRKDVQVTGRSRLDYIYGNLQGAVFGPRNPSGFKEGIDDFIKGTGYELKQYLDNFECMLLLIEQHCLKTNRPVKDSDYARITFSQLSDEERSIVLYTLGNKKETRELLEKFIDLNKLNPAQVEHCSWLKGEYRIGDE